MLTEQKLPAVGVAGFEERPSRLLGFLINHAAICGIEVESASSSLHKKSFHRHNLSTDIQQCNFRSHGPEMFAEVADFPQVMFTMKVRDDLELQFSSVSSVLQICT